MGGYETSCLRLVILVEDPGDKGLPVTHQRELLYIVPVAEVTPERIDINGVLDDAVNAATSAIGVARALTGRFYRSSSDGRIPGSKFFSGRRRRTT